MEYFTHERISKRIIRIVDISDTASYLVEGNEKACLIDTGSGIGSLRAYVDSLTNLAYDVVLTHGHVDHASGAWEFKDKKVYLHPEDCELMKVHTVFDNRTGYVENVKKITIPEEDLIPQLDPAETLEIAHGDIFDLGDVHVEIVHTPGHTRGMCMVLIQEERTILFDDGCGVSVMLLDEYSTSVEEYLDVLKHLKKKEESHDYIIRNHGTFVSPKELLDNVIECAQLVIREEDDHVPAVGLPVYYEDAYFAKALKPNGHGRLDGKEGNLAYRPCKIH